MINPKTLEHAQQLVRGGMSLHAVHTSLNIQVSYPTFTKYLKQYESGNYVYKPTYEQRLETIKDLIYRLEQFPNVDAKATVDKIKKLTEGK